jgi:hypothetical protein
MNFSKLSAADKRLLIAAAGVIVGGVVGIIDAWGIGATVGLLAGLAAAGVLLLPQLSPATKLPAPKATSLLILGAIAAIGFGLSALTYISYVLDVTRIYTILFDIGLVAAIALLWFAWLGYQAEQGKGSPPAA